MGGLPCDGGVGLVCGPGVARGLECAELGGEGGEVVASGDGVGCVISRTDGAAGRCGWCARARTQRLACYRKPKSRSLISDPRPPISSRSSGDERCSSITCKNGKNCAHVFIK